MTEPTFLGFFAETVTWETVKELVAALIGAMAGAYVGAMAATRIAAREKEREMFLAEIRSANAANSLCFSICNGALGLKKQHVLPMVQRFHKLQATFLEIEKAREIGQFPKDRVVTFQADLQLLPTMVLPTAELQRMCVEKLTLTGRPMAAVNVLHQCAVSFDEACRRRTKIIERCMEGRREGKDPIPLTEYFGWRDKDGHVNRDFPDTLEAIYKMLDELIYFSWLLAEDLSTHGDQVSALYRRRYGRKSLPVVRRADFSQAKQDGLWPAVADFADWLRAFPPPLKKTLKEKVLEALPFRRK